MIFKILLLFWSTANVEMTARAGSLPLPQPLLPVYLGSSAGLLFGGGFFFCCLKQIAIQTLYVAG